MAKLVQSKIAYGGDYNPEQWPRDVWDEDVRMFELANIDIATVGVFSWVKHQPNEETYTFEWMDEVLNHLHNHGIRACLATGTAAHPAWMAKKYPDILRVDFAGRKHNFGQRHNSCPNSPTYRKFSVALAEKLAERYKDHPALAVWHISNEYGGACYCDNCAREFRVWVKNRYHTIDRLNEVWNTAFWGHTFTDWDEVVPPNLLSEHMSESQPTRTAFQGISLDYSRFMSDSILACYRLEYDAIRKHTPNIPITTNLMGTFKPLDYFEWAKYMDIVSWDNYPAYDTPPSQVAFRHDLMRGLKHGQSFMLMEQTPSQQNWQPYNSLKRPGVMRLQSYQAVAHGADTVMFFQLRRSRGACEKFHGAVIEHVGHEDTRVFQETAQLGHELKQLGDRLLEARTKASVGILFDWANWWAVEYSSGPSVDLKYVSEVTKYYEALYNEHISVDVIGKETDFSQYDIVIAPVLYMVTQQDAEKIRAYVKNGGKFITTFFSGIVDEHDLVHLGGYPGPLRDVLGIWSEEIDALPPNKHNQIVVQEADGRFQGTYDCFMLYDRIHSEGAEVLAVYGDDFYRGEPVITRNQFGQGFAYYVASSPDDRFLRDFLRVICEKSSIQSLIQASEKVEATLREKDGQAYLTVLNHSSEPQAVTLLAGRGTDALSGRVVEGSFVAEPYGVYIIQLKII
ncbi:beta-galactosidase [Alicyclobacillus ferrooxydans]|uniref:Beta-galactosidase n=1 Tax=Alicyclobacillus ferrooxydans TaxID=471514 RepID=A0A0P9CXD8_9BACL|nr:beta-galactosidase [Alicyclobacillus ferrooxydans]KPV44422.1 beta-galactosidase [Alicyclobacillus ferrooxydans]